MNDELRYFLTEGPRTVKDLARLTNLSTSTIYKQLKDAPGISQKEGPSGKVFWIAPEGALDGPGAQENAPKAATPSPAPAPTQSGLKAERRGRKATGAGKRLFAEESLKEHRGDGLTVYTNPRRKGSHGYNSLQLVIDNPGILTEEYLARGGRLNDLRWDIAYGRVKLED